MPTEPLHNPLTPAEYDALMDAAKARAQVLRREAIDALWRDMGGLWQKVPLVVPRAAQRLAHRLARHVQHRQKTQSHSTPGA